MIHKIPTLTAFLAVTFVSSFFGSKCLAESYYTESPIFNPYPADNSSRPWNVKNFGPVGIGIDIKAPGMTMYVSNVEKGSPAEKTKKLKKGQIIESINGMVLKDRDPRVILGDIITEAEATDGKIRLQIQGESEVLVTIPVMGRYSETWPLNCPKSDKIVRDLADVHATFDKPRWGSVLFLLSTGEDKDLAVVKRWMKDFKAGEALHWYIGFSGPGICEYYLRTGDASVLPEIKKMTQILQKNMYNGGWSGRGAPASFTYSVGTGQVHASGMPCVTFLLMARLCGVEVDEFTLQESLKAFYRFAGHGNVAYGDGLPEGGFRDNGKTGALALAMNAATMLTPNGEKTVYADARDNSAMKSFYATNWFHAAHTGGGMGEIWHHAAMNVVREKRATPYRSFLDTRRWVMDLSRRFDGSIGIGGMTDRYDASATEDNMDWGTLFALTYTLPRKHLQLFGAPRSKWAKYHPLPERPWGTPADDIFQSPEPVSHESISMEDILKETVEKDASLPASRRMGDPNVSNETLIYYMHHPEFGLRSDAIKKVVELGKYEFIVPLLKGQDARLRHLGVLALTGMFKGKAIPTDQITPEMFDLIGNIVQNRDEAWWVTQDAIHALAKAPKPVIGKHRDRLLELLEYDSTWIQMAAVITLAKIGAEPEHYKIVLPKIVYTTSHFTNDSASYRSSTAIREAVASGSPEAKAFAAPLVKTAYAEVPEELIAPGGAVLSGGARTVKSRIGSIIQQLPGGNDFIRHLPKGTLAYAKSGSESDLFVYDGFKPNPKVVGKWLNLTKNGTYPLDDKKMSNIIESAYKFIEVKKGRTGRNRYRPSYLTLKDNGEVERDGNKFWSGEMLILNNEAEARRMTIRNLDGKEYLLVEIGNFPEKAGKDWHCGYDFYVREK